MRARCFRVIGLLLAGPIVLASSHSLPGRVVTAKGQADADVQAAVPPRFELDPSWPKPLPAGKAWPDLKRAATSVAVDSRDHVWIFQVPSAADREAEARGTHYLAVDSQGNIFNTGLQKFVFKGVPTRDELFGRSLSR